MKFQFNKIVKWLPIITFSIFHIWVYRVWLFGSGILSHGDWRFLGNKTLIDVRMRYFSTWFSDGELGRFLIDNAQAPTYSMYGVLAYAWGIGFGQIERIIHLIPIVILAPLCSYSLIYRFTRSKIGSLFGTGIFCYNTYFLTLQTGHITLAAAYSLVPLALIALDEFLIRPCLKHTMYLVIAMQLITVYEPRMVYVVAIAGVVIVVRSIVSTIIWKQSIQLLKQLVILVVGYILLNSYWIFGFISPHGGGQRSILERGLWGNDFYNIWNSVALYHPFWTFADPIPFENQPISVLAWSIPLIALIGGVVMWRNRYVQMFSIVTLIGILLSKQSDVPFTSLYQWLFEYVPGFKAFREASKFYILTSLGYSILGAFGLKYLVSVDVRGFKVMGNIWRLSLPLVCCITLLLNIFPVGLGQVSLLMKERNMPEDYKVYNSFIERQPSFFRTLFVPRASQWATYTSMHPIMSASNLVGEENILGTTTYSNSLTPQGDFERIISLFQRSYSNNILDSYGVKYIVVPLVDEQNNDTFFRDYLPYDNQLEKDEIDVNVVRRKYIAELDKITYLKKKPLPFQNLVVYENEGFQSRFTVSNDVYGVGKSTLTDTYFEKLNENYYDTKTMYISNSDIIEQEIVPVFDIPKRGQTDVLSLDSKLLGDKMELQYNQKWMIQYEKLENTIRFYATPYTSFIEIEGKRLNSTVIEIGEFVWDKSANIITINDTIVKISELTGVVFEAMPMEEISISILDQNGVVINFLKQKLPVVPRDDDQVSKGAKMSLKYPSNMGKNILINGSFEEGGWGQVADCNNYNENPIFESIVDTTNSSDGDKSMSFNVGNHLPCISQEVVLQPGGLYSIDMDYKTNRKGLVGYILQFDNSDGELLKKNYITSKPGNWQHSSELISVPSSVSNAVITLYGFPPDDDTRQITNYDNISIVQHPTGIQDTYFAQKKDRKLGGQTPQIVEQNDFGFTQKKLIIISDSTPYYLHFSEQFDIGWGIVNPYSTKPFENDIFKSSHVTTNFALNSWKIDPVEFCEIVKQDCHVSDTGLYEIIINIEYLPQRMMNIGIWVSIIICLGIIIVAVFSSPFNHDREDQLMLT